MSFTVARTWFLLSTTIALAACSGSNDAPAPASATPAAPAAASAAPAAMVTLTEYAAAAAPAGGNCALDAVNGGASPSTAVAAGTDVAMSGWFANAVNAVPVDAKLVLTGASRSYAGSLPAGVERPDVAAALSSESARMSGFNVVASLAGVEPGDYAISVVAGGDVPQACTFAKALSVGAGS